jgi:hypothetical protein
MQGMELEFKEKLWRWQGDAPAAWHFITLPVDAAGQIKFAVGQRKGFGMVRLSAQIGMTRWKTSVFSDKKSGSFLLPVKAAVRKSERLKAGQMVSVRLSLDV